VTQRALDAVTFDCWNTLIMDRDLDAARSLRATALIESAAAHGVQIDHDRAIEAIRAAHKRHIALWGRGVGSGAIEMAAWSLENVGISDLSLIPTPRPHSAMWRLCAARIASIARS
jgi:hypothetical protein